MNNNCKYSKGYGQPRKIIGPIFSYATASFLSQNIFIASSSNKLYKLSYENLNKSMPGI